MASLSSSRPSNGTSELEKKDEEDRPDPEAKHASDEKLRENEQQTLTRPTMPVESFIFTTAQQGDNSNNIFSAQTYRDSIEAGESSPERAAGAGATVSDSHGEIPPKEREREVGSVEGRQDINETRIRKQHSVTIEDEATDDSNGFEHGMVREDEEAGDDNDHPPMQKREERAGKTTSCSSRMCCCPSRDKSAKLHSTSIVPTKRKKSSKNRRKTYYQEFVDCFINRTVPLDPLGRLRFLWDIPILVCVVYTILFIPFSIGWSTAYLPWIAFDIVVNVLFILDIVWNFHTSYRNDEGELEQSFKKCARRYALTWFPVDVLASFPYDLVLLLLEIDQVYTQAFKILKIFRLLRVTILFRYVRRIGLSVGSSLIALICGFVVFCHWLGCLFWFIAATEGLPKSWVAAQSSIIDLISAPQSVQYTASLYWAVVTAATLGYGDITAVTYAEQIYCIIAIIIGALFYALVIATVQQIVTWKFSSGAEYNRWMDSVTRFADAHHLPPTLRRKLVGYYRYVWERRKTFDNSTILDDLPFELRADVAEIIHSKLFQANPVFCVAGVAFKHMLAAKLGPGKVKLPDDVLFFEGESVLDVVLVRRGALELVAGLDSADELIVSARKDGQYCGDLGLFDEIRFHFVSVVVADYSDIHQIPAEDFLSILENFPREKLLFERVAEARTLAIETLLQKFRDHAHEWKDSHRFDWKAGSKRTRDLTGLFTSQRGITSQRGLNHIHSPHNPKSQVNLENDLWKAWEDSISPDADDILCSKVIQLPVPVNIYGEPGMWKQRSSRETEEEEEEAVRVAANQDIAAAADPKLVQIAKNKAEKPPISFDFMSAGDALPLTSEHFMLDLGSKRRRKADVMFSASPSSAQAIHQQPNNVMLPDRGPRLSSRSTPPSQEARNIETLVTALSLQIDSLERKLTSMNQSSSRSTTRRASITRAYSDPEIM